VKKGAGFIRIVALIYLAIMLSMPVILYISVILINSMIVEIKSVSVKSFKITRPRYNHYISNSKLRIEITLSTFFNIID